MVKADSSGGGSAHGIQEAKKKKKKREEGAGSQYPLQGYTPSDLTSFH
jgi:hypothetical protein